MLSRSLGHRAPLLWLVLPYLTGLTAGHLGWVCPILPILILAGAGTALAFWAAGRQPWLWAATLGLALFLAATAHYQLQRARLPVWRDLPPREARLTIRVDHTFVQKDPRRITGLGRIVATEAHLAELRGQRLYFSLQLRPGAAPPLRSAEISTLGVLSLLPEHPPPENFEHYLAAAGMNFQLTRGQLMATARPASAYHRFCAAAAARFKAILHLGIGEKRPELAGLLSAMLLGETNELSDEQRTLFMQSGTMHLFAISGLNIGVIATALQALLLLLRLPRVVRLLASLALLWLFVDITGASASAVRAFIMAAFLQLAFVLEKPASPLSALVASAALVLLWAPQQLFSASFQMSYGIVLALLLMGLPLGEAWLARWTPFRDLPVVTWRWWQHGVDFAWRGLATALAIGVATTLVSLLTSVQFFQLLTPVSLLANLALIPTAMLATLGGFVALLCGLAGLDGLAAFFNHAAALTLQLIEWLVRLSVAVPGAHLPARFTASWIGPLTLALTLGALLYGYATRWAWHRGGWVPPFVIVALTLIFGVKFS